MTIRALKPFVVTAEAWERRWNATSERLRATEAENARLRAALDELNADVDELLNVAGQAGHEAAKSHTIRTQMACIRRLRARLRELEPAEVPTATADAFDNMLGRPLDALDRLATPIPEIRSEGEDQ